MGDRLQADHGYRLYAALCERDGSLKSVEWQLNTINGIPDKQGWIKLGRKSELLIRCPLTELDRFGQLDRQVIRIGQGFIELGELEGRSLDPSRTELSCRLCVIKSGAHAHVDPFRFGVAVGKQLGKAGIGASPTLGERKTVKVHNFSLVGYGLSITELSPWQSLWLQRYGLGGKRRMGCGVFV